MHLAVTANRQAKHFAQRVDTTHTHAMQATGNLVAVLVEFAPRMQLGQRNFSSRTLGLMFVIHLYAGRNPASVVRHADGIIRMNRHHDVVTMPGQGFVDRVVHHLENQVVQARAI